MGDKNSTGMGLGLLRDLMTSVRKVVCCQGGQLQMTHTRAEILQGSSADPVYRLVLYGSQPIKLGTAMKLA